MISFLAAAFALLLTAAAAAAAVLLFYKRKAGVAGASPSFLQSEVIRSDQAHSLGSPMAEEPDGASGVADSADRCLSRAMALVPTALSKARRAVGFTGRWLAIIDRLERVPACLSDLSSHPCFAKNSLCLELLQAVVATLSDAVDLADQCRAAPNSGKLQMQSDLDALSSKLDVNLRDCVLLVKTGVLNEAAPLLPTPSAMLQHNNVRELLARLQIGHSEAKHRAVDSLLDALHKDEHSVHAILSRSNLAALIQLLTATVPKVREKAATIICQLVESRTCESLLMSEGVLPPLIRLVESGSLIGREKALTAIRSLSVSPNIARSIVGHGGVQPLLEVCQLGDSISQCAAAGTLKNLSAVPDIRQVLADEGIVRVMINLLDSAMVTSSKDYAAQCLQNLTASNDCLRRSVVSEGGLKSLLLHLDGPSPQESGAAAVRNLVGSVSIDSLVLLGLLPRLAHVLKDGSEGAQQAAATTICRISGSPEMKRMIGEAGCVPLLVGMLDAKPSGIREVAAQAVASLASCPQNAREIRKDESTVPNLVRLLEPGSWNTARKYAVSCLLQLSSSKRVRKSMVAHGAVGYLKKLPEVDVAGAKKLLERLERRKLTNLLIRS